MLGEIDDGDPIEIAHLLLMLVECGPGLDEQVGRRKNVFRKRGQGGHGDNSGSGAEPLASVHGYSWILY